MSIKVGINGFGRMGRLGFRAGFDNKEYTISQINEACGTVKSAAHLLEYDTVHGKWQRDISASQTHLHIDNSKIPVTLHDRIESVDWSDCDIVIDCTGSHKTSLALRPYFDQGVKKVIVACPIKDDSVLNVVMGCNDHLYDPQEHNIITAASCTTNCIAPVIKVIHENLEVEKGTFTTIHDLTNTQVIVDSPHKDLRRARSAVNSLIPTSTGSAAAIALIYPELEGKLDGIAIRVPILNASLTDCVFLVKRNTSVKEVNSMLNKAATGALSGILGYENKPLVSADYVNDKRSGIVDAQSTMVTNGNLVKLLVWYDNEVGYAARMMELCQKVAKLL